MKLSTRPQYGTRALLDLAIHSSGEPVQLKDIADRQQIPLPYLEHIVAPLIRAGMINSTRGPRGGIWLAKPSQEIKLIAVVTLLENSLAPVECLNNPERCPRSGFCAPQDIWGELGKAIHNVLDSTTLQDLVERQEEKEHSKAPMYHI